MANIKNIVVAATATAITGVSAALILKHVDAKKAAEQKAAFEKAEAELQAQQSERSAKVKAHNEEVLNNLEESERRSNEVRANIDRAYAIEDKVIELEEKLNSARRTGSAIPDSELNNMVVELHVLAKGIDEVAPAIHDYFKNDVVVARTRDKISKVHDIVTNRLYFKDEKEA